MSTTTQTYFPDAPVHPGETLQEVLESLSLSVLDVAVRTGITPKHISHIINGKALITPEMALKLEKVTGTKASFWNNLSRNYQASLAALEEQVHLVQEAEHIEAFRETYRELSAKGILPKIPWLKGNLTAITRELLQFFSTHSLTFVPQTQAAAYRRREQEVNQNTMAAIIRLGERKAQTVQTEPFNRVALRAALGEIKSYSLFKQGEYLPLLEEKLRTLGIVLVCVPGFSHTGLQGAAKWVDTDKAMIILKADGQTAVTSFDEGKFWFNLFHEIGHLVLHGKKQTFIDLEDDPTSPEEKEVNLFASTQLVGNVQIPDLQEYKRGSAIRADLAVQGLAKKYGVSQSVAAGHLSHLFKKTQPSVYAVLGDYQKPLSYSNY